MGVSAARGRTGAIVGINVTPLVDITLVLLIIFMVTAKLIVNRDALPVDLPKAATGDEIQEVLSVVLASPTGTQVNGETLPNDDAIASRARALVAVHKDLRAVIKADGDLSHRRVMHVLDLLRAEGISKIGFGVLPIAPAAAP